MKTFPSLLPGLSALGLFLWLTASGAPAGPLVLRHRWQFNENAGAAAFADAQAPAETARRALARGTVTAGGGKVTLAGGASDTAGYIDLPNGMASGRAGDATFEGWASINGSQNWSRLFDFGSSTAGEPTAPGGSGAGVEYLVLAAQNGAAQTTQRLELSENGVLATGDPTVAYTEGAQFHFVVVYDEDGNAGQPQLRYYKDGTLVSTVNATQLLKNVADPNCWLGRSNFTADNNLQGAFNEFRVWDGAMEQAEITDSAAAFASGELPNALHVDSFTASPPTFYAGQRVTLSWTISNPGGALTGTINNGGGSFTAATGSVIVTPSATTTYALSVTNGTATRTASARVVLDTATITAAHQTLSTPYQTAKPVTLSATATPAAAMTYTITRPPGHGTLTGTPPAVTYTPEPGFTGLDNFAFTASAGALVSNVGGVSITVTPDIPTAAETSVSTAFHTPVAIALPASDPDNEPLTYTIVDAPANGALSGTGAGRTYTPAEGFAGTDTFTFQVSDGTYPSEPAAVTVTVHPPPAAPDGLVLSDDKILTTDTVGSFLARLQANDPNPGDTHTFTLAPGEGDTDNALVSIQGNQLLANASFAAASGQSVSIRVRVTDNTGRGVDQMITLPVRLPTRNIVINEIHYNPARNEIPAEFVELYNPFPSAVDVSGWKLSGGVNFTLPAGTIIAAGGYLVIAENPAVLAGVYGVTALGPWTGNLSGDGEDLELVNASNTVVDEVVYGVVSPWPASPNGDGPSLELINPALNNEAGSNWKASAKPAGSFAWLPAASAGWKYRKGTAANGEASAPREAWRAPGFTEDATWLTGTTPLGTTLVQSVKDETGIAVINTRLTDMTAASYRSVTMRKTFEVTGALPKTVLLRVLHNDAAIVWINGIEATRMGVRPGDQAYNTTDYYERGNDPWSEIVLANADQLFVQGTNTIAIQGFAKPPQVRSAQDDGAVYGNYDFAIDAEIRNVPDGLPTPGAQNSVFSENAAPAVRDITHSPNAPSAGDSVTVTARVTDPQGVQTVELLYQAVAPGAFIPARLPLTAAQLVANPDAARPVNPAFENPANWLVVPMTDNGSAAGDTAGDSFFHGVIPAQPHRSLVRYRIRVTDFAGNTSLLPYADDPSLNWAYFSYNGVPAYTSGANTFTPAQLTSVPVYHFIMREADRLTLMAYNGAEQMANSIALNALQARRRENWECALVYDGKVYDHILTRLRGGNSRYMGNGKRHLRINFNKGYGFEARDEKGRAYPVKWDAMLVNKMFGNKGYANWGLDMEVGAKLWDLYGVPVPEAHWFHMRMVRSAAEAPAPTTGDFYGLFQATEFVDRRFLEARNMEKGNVYKLSDWTQNGEMLDRYGAPGAPMFGEDYDNFRYNIHGAATEEFINTAVNMPLYYRYNAVQEAIRHYDIFTEPTGRHRMKNLILYFEPGTGLEGLGQATVMPYDWDASFGPNWNSGQDTVLNGIYNYNTFPDSPTWGSIKPRPTMQIERRNVVREFRDLFWKEDQLNPMIDEALAAIADIWRADRARWPATGAQADHVNGPVFKAQDMKNFAFTGWTDPFNGDPSVPGGRDAYLDSLADAGGPNDRLQIPGTPSVSYSGEPDYPLDGLRFTTTGFTDPQGASTFAAMQWRVGEITDPAAPAYVPGSDGVYEGEAVWESGKLPEQNLTLALPAGALKVGRTYRARVRFMDTTGRAGHWSQPLQFTTTGPDVLEDLRKYLIVSEFMYKPSGPSPAQAALGYVDGDFEYVELRNLSATEALFLTNVRFTKGIDFDFPEGAILSPGAVTVVVKNAAAFTSRYGPGLPVAGVWQDGQSLSNSGEQLKLSYGSGVTVRDFTYSDSDPWPAEGDSGGISLVYAGPAPTGGDDDADPQAEAANWRGSYYQEGSPGAEEYTSLASWMNARGYVNAAADPDGDGFNHLADFAFARDLFAPPPDPFLEDGAEGEYLTMNYVRRPGLTDVDFLHQVSTDLTVWNTADAAETGAFLNMDGTETVTVRVNVSTLARPRCYLRVKAISP